MNEEFKAFAQSFADWAKDANTEEIQRKIKELGEPEFEKGKIAKEVLKREINRRFGQFAA